MQTEIKTIWSETRERREIAIRDWLVEECHNSSCVLTKWPVQKTWSVRDDTDQN